MLAPMVISIGGRDRMPRMVVLLGALVSSAAVVAFAIAPSDLAGLANRAWDVLLGVWGVSIALRPAGALPRRSNVPNVTR
jgi:hypothetical protein